MAFQYAPFKYNQVLVTGTATLIADENPDRKTISITNMGSVDVFIGDSVVTAATGDLLTGTKGTTKSYITTEALYGICGSEQKVSYLEVQ